MLEDITFCRAFEDITFCKDVGAKMFYSIDFFKLLLRTDNELLVPEMKKNGAHRLRFRDKACVKLSDFEKLARVK